MSQTSTRFSFSLFSITQHFPPLLSRSLCKCQPLTDPLNTTQHKKHYDDPTFSKSSDSLRRLHQLLCPCDSSIPTLTSFILSTRLVERSVNKQGIGKCVCLCVCVLSRLTAFSILGELDFACPLLPSPPAAALWQVTSCCFTGERFSPKDPVGCRDSQSRMINRRPWPKKPPWRCAACVWAQ